MCRHGGRAQELNRREIVKPSWLWNSGFVKVGMALQSKNSGRVKLKASGFWDDVVQAR
jgi:hypothetical protein